MAPEHRVISFSGSRGGTGNLTWGQKLIWRAVTLLAPNHQRMNMWTSVAVPDGCTTDAVLSALSTLIERHETMRTRFHVDEDDTPRQVVAESGELSVEVTEDAGPEAVERLRERLCAAAFWVPEFSVRAGVLTDGGRPVTVGLAMFHMAADEQGIQKIGDDLALLLRAGLDGTEPPSADEINHPLDRAEYESGPEGQELSRRAIRRWENELNKFPHAMLPMAPEAAEDPRFRQTTMTSAAVRSATSALAERHGVSLEAVLLGFTSIILCRLTGNTSCGVLFFFHNRSSEDSKALSGTTVQNSPIGVEVGGNTLQEILKRCHEASILAGLYGTYDPNDLTAMFRGYTARMGHPPELSYGINLVLSQNSSEPAAPTGPKDVEAARGEMSATRFEEKTLASPRGMKFYFEADDADEGTRIGVKFDTAVFTPDRIRELLGDLEQALVAAMAVDGSVVPGTPDGGGPAW